MPLTNASGESMCADEKARKLLAGIALDKDAWNKYPPSLDELADKVDTYLDESYEDENVRFIDLLEEADESEMSEEAYAATYKVGMHLTGNFISYEDVSDLFDAEFNEYSPGSGELWSQAQYVKDFIGLDEPLKKESIRYNSL